MTLKVRARGILLGFAYCDALGTTSEFLSWGEALSLNGVIGRGPFNLEAGNRTDDTSMALCLADAFLVEK